MGILGCEPLYRHEELKIVLAVTDVRNLINIWQLHSKMWMMLLDGGGM
jgi:hypothetical protein